MKLRKAAQWPAQLSFNDFSVGLERVKYYFSHNEALLCHVAGLEQFYTTVVTDSLATIWREIEVGGIVTEEEKSAYTTLLENPVLDLSQWISAAEVSIPRNIVSHPFTVGTKLDLQKSKLELAVLEGASNSDISSKLKNVLILCISHCRCRIHLAAAKIQVVEESLEAMFQDVSMPTN